MKSAHCIMLIYFHCVWYSTFSHMFSLNFFSLLNIKRSKNISVSTTVILTWKHIRFLALLLNILRNSLFFLKKAKMRTINIFFFLRLYTYSIYWEEDLWNHASPAKLIYTVIYTDITGTWWLDQVVCSIVQRYWAIGHRCQPI